MFLPPVGSPPGEIESKVATNGAPVSPSQILKLSPTAQNLSVGRPRSLYIVVQYDVSQGDYFGEYEQHLVIIPSSPLIIRSGYVLRTGSSVGIIQFKFLTITVGEYNDHITISWWIAPTVGTGTFNSGDRVITIDIL